MIIYNKEWLYNMRLINGLKDKLREGSITPEEFIAVKKAHPFYFYLPRLVIRVGLFILTFIIASFATGLLSLLGLRTHMIESPGWPIFLGAVCYGALEFFVKENRYFHSGVDNALLYYSASLFGGGFIWMITKMHLTGGESLLDAVFICLLCLYLTLRFADVITAAVACVSGFACVYFFWEMMGNIGVATMPFMMMIAAAITYYAFHKLNHVYYNNCISIVKILSLVTLYAAGNYYVVNSLNNLLNHLDDTHTYVPLGFIFWIWTVLLPLVYVWFGLKRKDTILLRTGLILAGLSVATFRNYYHLLPIEVMLTLAGMILLSASYTIIKYLKIPRHGVTYAEPEEANTLDSLNIEGLVIGQATSHLPTATPHTERFGGGTGGGGGSSDSF
ncbi:hypothetical protein [Mucilaginibacter phyllosphaerae]